MKLFKSKQEKNSKKFIDKIRKARHIAYNNPQRTDLIMSIMQSTNTRSDDITVGEAYAILVAYYTAGMASTQIDILALIILVEFNAQNEKEMTTDRSIELAKRCDVLFADILKKQAGLT